MNDLQLLNLLSCVKRMTPVPGWDLLVRKGVVALKSPAKRPLANFVWGVATPFNIELCAAFYGDRDYSWHVQEGEDPSVLLAAGFKAADPTPEMLFHLTPHNHREPGPGIRVIRPASLEELRTWYRLVGETFTTPLDEVEEFYLPLISRNVCTPYLALYDDQPAATAMVCLSQTGAGIYAVGTRPEFRRKGVGQAVIHACLDEARGAGLDNAVLYSSVMGRPFYESLGFTLVQVLGEYVTPGHPCGI